MNVYIAKQAILNREDEIVAYELLYRENNINQFDFNVSSLVATSILLMNSYYTFGIENLVGECKAYINFDDMLIKAKIPLLLDHKKVVIELLETIQPDKNLMIQLRQLRDKNYLLAADDMVWNDEYDGREELIDLCNILKIDFSLNSHEEICWLINKWKRRGKILLAEKIENKSDYEWAFDNGFDLFQGFYLSKPELLHGKKTQDTSYNHDKLQDILSNESIDHRKVIYCIEKDPTLSYKLLKMVNSRYSLTHKVASIEEALEILGFDRLKAWLTMNMLEEVSKEKPSEFLKIAIYRSYFLECAVLGTEYEEHLKELSLLGSLSVVDCILDQSMDQILKELPINESLMKALKKEPSEQTSFYELILAIEKDEKEKIEEYVKILGLDREKIMEIDRKARNWANQTYEMLVNYGD